ncbi:FeoA family protein [Moraxella sp. ZY210820]|uniref:FeoA family protein n=1 Tax=unclassified Moraxella TaxID=2685852 RepID=UPI00272F8497|nr:FeoA family protein [Moraxella sp. ZY210820]WLF83491.1 ferrous iron transport protein A [Moraxella sp. ZY210820]
MRLSDLKAKQSATISGIIQDATTQPDIVANRLEVLGFLVGTPVKVITKGMFGGEPILVQIGFTRFALRKTEAERIEVEGVSA